MYNVVTTFTSIVVSTDPAEVTDVLHGRFVCPFGVASQSSYLHLSSFFPRRSLHQTSHFRNTPSQHQLLCVFLCYIIVFVIHRVCILKILSQWLFRAKPTRCTHTRTGCPSRSLSSSHCNNSEQNRRSPHQHKTKPFPPEKMPDPAPPEPPLLVATTSQVAPLPVPVQFLDEKPFQIRGF